MSTRRKLLDHPTITASAIISATSAREAAVFCREQCRQAGEVVTAAGRTNFRLTML